jgi:threonylcarbamoyladenosine tRNA methylthiotransferase MtaB
LLIFARHITELMPTGNAGKKVALTTLGCKLNYAETSTISRKFLDGGFQRVRFGEEADIIVINTCSVTQQADRKCKLAIKKAIKSSPSAFIAVIGCYSQLKTKEIASITGVDLVLGTKEKFHILDYIGDLTKHNNPTIYSCGIEIIHEFESSYSLSDRTRAFLKVQDGCDYQCAYCTIPLARGNSRNPQINELLNNVLEIAARGTKEIVLTGVNVGDFGRSTSNSFIELLHEFEKVDAIQRFRISSIEPNLLTYEIIKFVAGSKKFMPHFHIPLQSGCNEILKNMARRYNRELFSERVQQIKSLMPYACIGVDVITGFPGETEEYFVDTYNFIKSLPVSYLHVFSYSERLNTKAAAMKGKIEPQEKETRSKKLIKLSETKRHEFYLSNLNMQWDILFESRATQGQLLGFTSNYIKVEIPLQSSLVNTIQKGKLIGISSMGNVNIELV